MDHGDMGHMPMKPMCRMDVCWLLHTCYTNRNANSRCADALHLGNLESLHNLQFMAHPQHRRSNLLSHRCRTPDRWLRSSPRGITTIWMLCWEAQRRFTQYVYLSPLPVSALSLRVLYVLCCLFCSFFLRTFGSCEAKISFCLIKTMMILREHRSFGQGDSRLKLVRGHMLPRLFYMESRSSIRSLSCESSPFLSRIYRRFWYWEFRLLFMTYNGWVMISVAVGAFIGFLFFGSNTTSAKVVTCH